MINKIELCGIERDVLKECTYNVPPREFFSHVKIFIECFLYFFFDIARDTNK